MAAITKSLSSHLLLVAIPAWGHLKPLIALAAKFVHERPDIIVTFTVTGDFRPKLENEINALFSDDEKDLKDHIRLLHVGEFEGSPMQVLQAYFPGFAKVYPSMYAEEPLHCATGQVYPPISKPDAIILDPFLFGMLQMVRSVSGNTIPILAWNTSALSAFLRLFGPESLGGLGDVPRKAEILAEATGRPKDEIEMELYNPETGELVKLPGLPPMYDYEFNAQHEDSSITAIRMFVIKQTYQSFKEWDGFIASGSITFEPEVCDAFRTWFAPRPVYFVGPLLLDKAQVAKSQAKKLTTFSNNEESKNFLDTIQKTHGDCSLLYISFGTSFWPVGESVWRVIEVVLKMRIPLILSYDPKRVEMPSYLQKQLEASNISLVLAWAPQEFILKHPTTAWFLTHCGSNSVAESISYGVPMIAWPLSADQPMTAAYLSSTLNIAFELYETRLGPGLRPLYRGINPQGTLEAIENEIRTVLDKAFSPDGAQKRENLHVLMKKINKAWDNDGEARIEFRKFLERFVSN